MILCPPTSPDLAYPIESLWANLKKNMKKRNPKDYEELKNFVLRNGTKKKTREIISKIN